MDGVMGGSKEGTECMQMALARMVFPIVCHTYPDGIQDGPKTKRCRALERKRWIDARLNIIINNN